ncbi:unnamed protein product, partial [Rotaria sp. Silwood2]
IWSQNPNTTSTLTVLGLGNNSLTLIEVPRIAPALINCFAKFMKPVPATLSNERPSTAQNSTHASVIRFRIKGHSVDVEAC